MKVNLLYSVPKNITLTTNLIFTKLKLWHKTSANTHLKLFLKFKIINRYLYKRHVPGNCKKGKGDYL